MNAQLQRWQLLLRLMATAGVMVMAWQAWGWGLAFGLSALVFWIHAPLMLLWFALMPCLNRHEAPTWAELLRAWAFEVVALDLVFAWQQPFAGERWPDHLPQDAGAFRPLLLLHGYTCNRGLWNPWLRSLSARGVPVVALTLEPAFGSIDDYVPQIEQALQGLALRYPDRRPLVLAHSMGGLALRAWRRDHGRPGRVDRMVTLGSPHAGTRLARWGRGRNGREMRRDCPWLRELSAQEASAVSDVTAFDCYYSRCDQIVFPVETARLPGAQAIEVKGTGHLGLVFHPQVQRDIWAALQLVQAAQGKEGAKAPSAKP